MDICHIVGARPNFMKAGPLIQALSAHSEVRQTLVHTGQHYDSNMSDVFFKQLGIPQPDINLQVGSGSHARQTAEIMIRLEEVILNRQPDLVLVYGDVNSTIAAALVCAKLLIPLGHIEAGLRSGDRTMPEEINRILTDQLADLLFTPSVDGNENLRKEGIPSHKIHFVGNIMIDSLVRLLPQAMASSNIDSPNRFVLVTLHRPANVDDSQWLKDMITALGEFSQEIPVLFPVHPRTRQRISEGAIQLSRKSQIKFLDPLPYLDFLRLEARATIVITDSGGIQEETTYLGIPCLTVRNNTERPITLTLGTNVLVGRDISFLKENIRQILSTNRKKGQVPELWDGHTAERIATILLSQRDEGQHKILEQNTNS